jgi:hypothetical protein
VENNKSTATVDVIQKTLILEPENKIAYTMTWVV